jgi:hypothetical protein
MLSRKFGLQVALFSAGFDASLGFMISDEIEGE